MNKYSYKGKIMNNKITTIAAMASLIVLGACTSTPKTLNISTQPIAKPNLTLPAADTLNLRSIEWLIVTEDNFQETMDKLKKEGKDPVLFALTDTGYERLSLNLADVRTYIQQQKTIIASYGRYYLNAEKQLENAQGQLDNINAQLVAENQKRVGSNRGSLFGIVTPIR